jgi:hemolysin activation/secretion protein
VIAARLTTSFGIDAFDATEAPSSVPGDEPDGDFAHWLVQLRYAARLPEHLLGSQLVLRGDLQLAQDPLFGLEQIAIGGRYSVRGYHENELVRDNGYAASIELRIPVLRDPLGRDRLQLAPFFDVGRSWSEHGDDGLRTLASAGLGLRWFASERAFFEVYWGGRFRSVPDRDGDPFQDAGVHVRATVVAF